MINKKYLVSIVHFVFVSIIVVWVIISLSRFGYNFVRLLTKEKEDVALSQEDKKKKYYAYTYTVSDFLKKHTLPTDTILLEGNDGRLYFYLRYAMYPQKILRLSDVNKFNSWKFKLVVANQPLPVKITLIRNDE